MNNAITVRHANRKKNFKKILILGSGALRIGQAGEFDYSGSQALKALKEEGITSILINPNIATIQTDEGLADKVYFLPVEPYFVEEIIRKEKIDGILLSFGGQTALNCGLTLDGTGVFEKHGVTVLGTPVATILETEDRHLFAKKLAEIKVDTAKSIAVYTVDEAVKAANIIGYPVMMRVGFALGGQGSSIVYHEAECRDIAVIALASSPQILVEECLKGWKEIEYEVVRDSGDNCITVCNMENFDPMGIHTGESIVVAPSQTLDDYEYQMLREIAIKTIRHLGIIGECNIQYALDPYSRQYRVIEVNARLSRSSALASKATGYPLAYIAAKIALGYLLSEISNSITKVTTAFFEPALDYIVCKFPRWDLDKFDMIDKRIGSEMKSVGEVMAIGRSFAEVIQKAIRMLEIGASGLDPEYYHFNNLKKEIQEPTPRRIFAIAKALKEGISVDEIASLSSIDKFYLYELARIVQIDREISNLNNLQAIDALLMRSIKKMGFSDKQIAKCLKSTENQVRHYRHSLGVRPWLSQIDTLAAEYPAQTNFLYFSYSADKTDFLSSGKSINKKVLVLGSGCYRIGSSVEFDWCAVSAVAEARKIGYETIMLNYNPETVSTDYDICEKLVFDEISLETVIELYDFEKPDGVIVSMGGQTPNNMALSLHNENIRIFGTSATSIDTAEDRNKFSSLLDRVGIEQPRWATMISINNLIDVVDHLGGFPVLVRPSYVLSGSAMRVAYQLDDLKIFLQKAADISQEYPVIMSKFEENAKEIEFDGVAKDGSVILYAMTEHIENAGVHSGDATLVIPAQWLTEEVKQKIKLIAEKIAYELNITGPFNIQMLAKNNVVKVIECNLRASRSFPYVSKAMGINFISEATRAVLGETTRRYNSEKLLQLGYVVIKSPQFSFNRLKGTDPRLGVEMASTGEVACFGVNYEKALLAAILASGFKPPQKSILISLEDNYYAEQLLNEVKQLIENGIKVYVTQKSKQIFLDHDVMVQTISNDPLILIKAREFDCVISIPLPGAVNVSNEGYLIRRCAIDMSIPLLVDLWLAKRAIHSFTLYKKEDINLFAWHEYLQGEYTKNVQVAEII